MLREKLGIDSINISSSSVGSKHEEFDGNINSSVEKTDRYSFSFYTEQYSKNLDAGKAQQTLMYSKISQRAQAAGQYRLEMESTTSSLLEIDRPERA
jgi:hypothetical protein